MKSLKQMLVIVVLFPVLTRGEGIRTENLRKLETKAFIKGYVGFKDYASAMLYYTYLMTFRNDFDFKHLRIKTWNSAFSVYRTKNRSYELPFNTPRFYFNNAKYSAMVMYRYKKAKSEIMKNMKTVLRNKNSSKFEPEKEKRIEDMKRALHQKYYDIHTEIAEENNLSDKILLIREAQAKQLNYVNRRSKK